MLNRVDAGGFTEASVVQQGTNIINVSVPGQKSQAVVKLVEQTAELLFRQVLLEAPNTPTADSHADADPPPAPAVRPARRASPSASASPRRQRRPLCAAPRTAAEWPRWPAAPAASAVTPRPRARRRPSRAPPRRRAAASPTPSTQATAPSRRRARAHAGERHLHLADGRRESDAGQPAGEGGIRQAQLRQTRTGSRRSGTPRRSGTTRTRQIVSCGNSASIPGQYEAGKFVAGQGPGAGQPDQKCQRLPAAGHHVLAGEPELQARGCDGVRQPHHADVRASTARASRRWMTWRSCWTAR